MLTKEKFISNSLVITKSSSLRDPGADSGGEGKSEREAKKTGEEKSPFSMVARLDSSPPLSAAMSRPKMSQSTLGSKVF